MTELTLLKPEWPLPDGVEAVISTRLGGHSHGVYASANLGDHVGDDASAVSANRAQLAAQCKISQWQWLQQVHGTAVVEAGPELLHLPVADGVTTCHRGIACAVLTADCLPVLLCAKDGQQVAALHAGWRGLVAGIIQQGLVQFHQPPTDVTAFLGPAIGPEHFEVGRDVYDAFAVWDIRAPLWQQLLQPRLNKPKHYWADLYGLARWCLQQQGVTSVFGGDTCTFNNEQFYSYRRDQLTGRMASAIWLTPVAAL